jgi:hypothetical protein
LREAWVDELMHHLYFRLQWKGWER